MLFLLLLWLPAAWGEIPVPPLKARVTDLTGSLSRQESAGLEQSLQDLESRSGAQVAILLVASTRPEAIAQFSLRVAEAWKLGRKGRDDGLLLVVAKADREARLEVGYGLEGAIPDAVARRVIAETMVPRFRQGDLAGGLAAAVERLGSLLDQQQAPREAPPGDLPMPSTAGLVMDMTGSLPPYDVFTLSRRFQDFYDSGRALAQLVLVVPAAGAEGLEQLAARALATWGEKDNLDINRSLLLVVAKEEGKARLAAGPDLARRLPPEAMAAAGQAIEPLLQAGNLEDALTAGAAEMEKLMDGALAQRDWDEKLLDWIGANPWPVIVGLTLAAILMRWLLGALPGGLAAAGLLGGGIWLLTGAPELALPAGLAALLLVGWGINLARRGARSARGRGRSRDRSDSFLGGDSFSSSDSGSSSSSSSSDSDFSGGGGDFGGGGASEKW